MPDEQKTEPLIVYAHKKAREMAFKECPAWPSGQHQQVAIVYWSVMAGYGFFPYYPGCPLR